MSKFKVGDVIVANDLANNNYGVTRHGWVGIVTLVGAISFRARGINDKNDESSYTHLRYNCFDLVKAKNPLIDKMEVL